MAPWQVEPHLDNIQKDLEELHDQFHLILELDTYVEQCFVNKLSANYPPNFWTIASL